MQSTKHAFQFIGASFSMALKYPQLQEPWFILGVGSLVILFFWFLPLAAVAALLGLSPWGLALIGLLVVCAIADLWIWGEMVALLTARAMNMINTEPEDESLSNFNFLKKYGNAILTLSIAKPVLLFWQALKRLVHSKGNERNLWLKTHTLTLPIIAAEGLPLKEALDRLRQVVKENLLPIQEKLVQVRLVSGLIQFLLTAAGIVLAFWLGLKLGGPEKTGPWQQVLAVGIAMLVGWLPTFIGILFSSYARTCYATALYHWAKNVETSHNTGNIESAQPPQILRQVLGSGRG